MRRATDRKMQEEQSKKQPKSIQKPIKEKSNQSNQSVFKWRPFARYRPENAGTVKENLTKKASKTNESNQTNQFSK